MKLGYLFIFLFLCHWGLGQTNTEKIQNPTCITFGPSASLLSRLGTTIISNDIYRVQNIPPLNLNLDWQSSTRFTLGIAIHYEDFKFYRTLRQNNGINLSSTNNLYTYGKFSEFAFSSTHINAGIRLLYHIHKNDNECYGGLRLALNYYSNYIFIRTSQRNPLAAQLVVGYRKFVGRLGFNLEGGLGYPYWCLTGINYRIEN